ncbi:MAG: neutral/alkaline non-lysosomal ceramidase N-terminal domain-containing protein, partial [Victivallales bacterium]|nr:neutral/alkaline non-lysosomal ceramidase N-terminal domain-containing protein [Victivallales bacterium]
MADEIKTLKVGVAQSDITPPIGTCLAGYFNKRVSTGIIHPLRAKAIVAGSGDERVALITCDLITMTAEVCQRVRKIVHDATGILESHVMICSTHTHTGPDLRPSNANCPR